MSVSFTHYASDGDMGMLGLPCKCAELALDSDDFVECEHRALDVHMNSNNGFGVIIALGLGTAEDYCGHVSADVLIAALLDNPGTHRADELMALATDASARRVDVGWS